jgi:hypothetical protein
MINEIFSEGKKIILANAKNSDVNWQVRGSVN